MQTTIRTTVRIRKDLFDQSRLLALKRDISLQEVINNILALGLGKVSDLESNKKAMVKIDKLRMSLLRSKNFSSSNKKINLEGLLSKSKLDLR